MSFLLFFLTLNLYTVYGVEVDGFIREGEYGNPFVFHEGAFKVFLKVEGEHLYLGIDANTKGWVAVGFDPASVMDQADMIIGWVDPSGQAHAVDCFSTGMFGPHPPDTELGGTNDVLAYAGREEGERTVLEVKRPLRTKDLYDKPLDPTKPLTIIWAYAETDGFDDMHLYAGSAVINLGTGEATQRRGTVFLFLHIGFMSLAVLLMVSGVAIARYFRKRPWWLKVHRALGVLSALFMGMGLGAIVVFVERTGGKHLKVPHGWVGLVAALGALVVPLMGQAFLKLKTHKKELRLFHRWGGRVTVSLMGIAAVMGLVLLRII